MADVDRPRALRRAARLSRRRAPRTRAPGRRRQRLLLVPPLSRHRRLLDLRRSRVSELRPQATRATSTPISSRPRRRKTSCRPTTTRLQSEVARARRDDAQSRPPHLGRAPAATMCALTDSNAPPIVRHAARTCWRRQPFLARRRDASPMMTVGTGLQRGSVRLGGASSPNSSTPCRWPSTRAAGCGWPRGRTIRTGSRRRAMDDKLLILEDTNGDGRADRRTVFAGDLHNPTGFEFYNGGVIVAQQPNLVFLQRHQRRRSLRREDRALARVRHGRHAPRHQQLRVGSGRRALHAGRHLPSHAGGNAVGAHAAAGRRRRVPLRAAHVEARHLRADELSEPARARVRRLGTRHHLRRHRRAAVLRAVVLDRRSTTRRWNRPRRPSPATCGCGPSAARRFSRAGTFPSRCRATSSCSTRSGSAAPQLPPDADGAGAEVDRSRSHPAVVRSELPAGRRRDCAGRLAVLPRLAQPRRRAHAAQPARHVARQSARPRVSRHAIPAGRC